MPKRVSKNKSRDDNPKAGVASAPRRQPASARSQGGAPAERGAADTESEFSVPQKWEENEQENAAASSGPASAARDGSRTEEAADTKPG